MMMNKLYFLNQDVFFVLHFPPAYMLIVMGVSWREDVPASHYDTTAIATAVPSNPYPL